jgi:hypothetical protein
MIMSACTDKWTPKRIAEFNELFSDFKWSSLAKRFGGPACVDSNGDIRKEFNDWFVDQRDEVLRARLERARTVTIVDDRPDSLKIKIDEELYWAVGENWVSRIRPFVEARTEELKEQVPIAIQYKGDIGIMRRKERQSFLAGKFNAIANILKSHGVSLDMAQMSPSGQTIPATVPERNFEALQSALKPVNFDVRRDSVMQVNR